jgi:hypothetical protein
VGLEGVGVDWPALSRFVGPVRLIWRWAGGRLADSEFRAVEALFQRFPVRCSSSQRRCAQGQRAGQPKMEITLV